MSVWMRNAFLNTVNIVFKSVKGNDGLAELSDFAFKTNLFFPEQFADLLLFLLSALCLDCPSLLSVLLTISLTHPVSYVWLYTSGFSSSLQPFISVWRLILYHPVTFTAMFFSFYIVSYFSCLHFLTIIWHFKGSAGYYE